MYMSCVNKVAYRADDIQQSILCTIYIMYVLKISGEAISPRNTSMCD